MNSVARPWAALRHCATATALIVALVLTACSSGGSAGASGSTPATFTLSGTISGLAASGLVLANGSDTLSVASGATAFTLPGAVASGASYSVTAQTQPAGFTCTVANGTGTATANVTNISVTCAANTYTLGGTVSGLSTSGLVLANGATTLSVAANATAFTLPGTVTSGTNYALTVQTQPTGLSCTIANGIGTATANVTNIAVTCTTIVANSFTIGGSISGLATSGLVLANGATTLSVAANATTFTLPGSVAPGSSYNVTVQTQPAGRTCTIANGSGTNIAANVTNIVVTCSAVTYTLGGTISGLTTAGLVLANGANTLSVLANATTFTLPGSVAAGSSYSVIVQTQPTGRTCTVANGSGPAVAGNVSNIAVTCVAATYTVGGTVAGLSSAGLVLVNNGATPLTITSGASSFTFPVAVAFGSSYSVTVQTQPSGRTCTIANGSGMVSANVTNVAITCTANNYTLGGTISGLTAPGLVLANGATTLTVAANATTFTMPGTVASGSSYNVTVQTQPAGNTCSVVSGGSGTVVAANVTNVAVTCTVNNYTLGGTISGLTTAGLVLANGATTLSVAANATTFTLPGTVAFGTSYNVTVQTQPTGFTCTITNGSATMGAANVTNVAVSCASTSYFTLGGTISGLTTSGLVLANGGTTLSVNTNSTTFTMPGTVASGTSYNVTVQTQPTGRTCAITNGSGTVGSANVTNIAVACVANGSFTVGGTISGLTASGLVLTNGSDTLSVTANATTFTMPTSVPTLSYYAVWISTQPSGLACSVGNGPGQMPANNVTNVTITCRAVGTALQPRYSDAGRTIILGYYNPALNITWLANTNAGAGSAFDDGKFNNDGRMTWNSAMAWAASLNLGGVSGWRLPTMIDTGAPGCSAQGEFSLTGGGSCGQNVITTPATPTNYSEMAYMYTVILGNSPAFNTSGGLNPSPWLRNTGPFTLNQGYNVVWYGTSACNSDLRNCRDDAYWYNLPDAASGGADSWKFLFGEGEQIGDQKNVEYFAWAVHNGDVGIP